MIPLVGFERLNAIALVNPFCLVGEKHCIPVERYPDFGGMAISINK